MKIEVTNVSMLPLVRHSQRQADKINELGLGTGCLNEINSPKAIAYLDSINFLGFLNECIKLPEDYSLLVEAYDTEGGLDILTAGIMSIIPVVGFKKFCLKVDVNLLKLNIDASNASNTLVQMLWHENTHIQQYLEGRLKVVNSEYLSFDGVLQRVRSSFENRYEYIEYITSPWEVEAYANQAAAVGLLYSDFIRDHLLPKGMAEQIGLVMFSSLDDTDEIVDYHIRPVVYPEQVTSLLFPEW